LPIIKKCKKREQKADNKETKDNSNGNWQSDIQSPKIKHKKIGKAKHEKRKKQMEIQININGTAKCMKSESKKSSAVK